MKNCFLVFPRHAEACKFAFWRFRATRKHENLLFGVSAPRGSMKKLFFGISAPRRSMKNYLFVLDTLYLIIKCGVMDTQKNGEDTKHLCVSFRRNSKLRQHAYYSNFRKSLFFIRQRVNISSTLKLDNKYGDSITMRYHPIS